MINKRGLSIFALLSILGLMCVFFLSADSVPLKQIIKHIDIRYFMLCVFAIPVVDWLTAGLRMWMFTNVTCPDISYVACVKNCAVGSFMGAATPSQTGGGIAQAYVLVKEGCTTGQAISILFMTFLSTLVFYTVASVSLWWLVTSDKLSDVNASTPFAIASLIFAGMTVLGFLIMIHPPGVKAVLRHVESWTHNKPRIKFGAERIALHVETSIITMKMLVKDHKFRCLLSVLITVIIFSNKYFAAYLAARTLGLHLPLFELIISQVFLHIMLYFLPTPGSSGGAEVGTAMIMSSMIAPALLPAYTLLWRTATMYFPVLVGGSILMHYISKETVRQKKVSS